MMNYRPKVNTSYLLSKQRVVRWKTVAGRGLSPIQSYDIIFDDYDLKIRQLGV